jgi:hypothetical protein
MKNEMLIETIECHGNKIEIGYDCNPINPREDWDSAVVFAFFHRNYKNESDIDTNDFSSLDEIREYIESRNGLNAICLPVYLYSHSGDTINTTGFSCPWDSGQLGFAYITKEMAREWWGWKNITQKRKEQLYEAIKGEVEVYDKYIKGEVYYHEVYDNEGNLIDSCHGFFDKDDCISEAISIAKNSEIAA